MEDDCAGVEGDGAGADAAGAGAAAGALFSEDSGLALVALPPSLLLSARLRFLSLSDLKSVSYQPLPANRNEGALTRRLSCGAPQLGQIVGSSSDSFCRRSKRCPQLAHSNS